MTFSGCSNAISPSEQRNDLVVGFLRAFIIGYFGLCDVQMKTWYRALNWKQRRALHTGIFLFVCSFAGVVIWGFPVFVGCALGWLGAVCALAYDEGKRGIGT